MTLHKKEAIKRDIVNCIGHGKGQAIKGKQLAYMVESDADGQDRNFRLLILELIVEGKPIASISSGYFMAETPDEVKEYAKSLRDRAKMNFIRRRDFLRAARPILQPTQIPMALVT